MIEKYVPMDRHHDNFYERFMEHRCQKLDKPEQLGLENSLPILIAPLHRFLMQHLKNESATLAVILETILFGSINQNASHT